MSASVERLEEKVAFLEQALQQLSDEHFAQQKELLDLKELVHALKEKLVNQSDSHDFSTQIDEKPPHY